MCVLVRGTVTLVHRYHKPETSYLAGSIKNWSQELKLNHQQLEIQHGTLFFFFFFVCVFICPPACLLHVWKRELEDFSEIFFLNPSQHISHH